MGGCCGKSASQIEEEEKQQQKDAAVERARSLGITAQFLRHWATLEEADLNALLAEIKRREEMPSMTITCLLPEEASQEECQITVRGYEAVGFSVSRELGVKLCRFQPRGEEGLAQFVKLGLRGARQLLVERPGGAVSP